MPQSRIPAQVKFPFWARVAFALLAFGTAVTAKACGQVAIIVDSSIVRPLDHLAHDSVEHVACLFGSTSPDTMFLNTYVIPPQAPVGRTGAYSDDRACLTALAHFHTHVVPKDSTATDYLYYSTTDQHSFTHVLQTQLGIVGVPGIWCFWTRLQINEAWTQHLTPLWPHPSQCIKLP